MLLERLKDHGTSPTCLHLLSFILWFLAENTRALFLFAKVIGHAWKLYVLIPEYNSHASSGHEAFYSERDVRLSASPNGKSKICINS